ncbi:MAG: T9SS type A sorting domain-containing protein, partial [Candidatus Edwardsbacteria bacterium]
CPFHCFLGSILCLLRDFPIGMVSRSQFNTNRDKSANNYAFLYNNLVGVYITNNAWPILGIKMSGQNRIEARWEKVDSSYAVYNDTKNYILAEGNWWGTNDEDSIAMVIWDYYDDKTKGIVDFRPFRQNKEVVKAGESDIQSNSETREVREYSFRVQTVVTEKYIRIFYSIPTVNPITRATIGNTNVSLEIYDIIGRLTKRILWAESPGNKQYSVNCGDLASGVYFIRFRADNYYERIRKVVLVR